MRSLRTYFQILLIACIGILFGYVLYNSYHKDNLFEIIIYVVLGSIWSVLFYLSVEYDKDNYRKSNIIGRYASTFIGIVIIISNLGIFSYYQFKLLSPALIKAEGHGVYANFKKNGEYIIKSGSWATKTHYYGEYQLQNGLIILDRDTIDDVLFTNKYIICFLSNPDNKNLYWKIEGRKNYIIPLVIDSTKRDTLLLGYDKNGEEVRGSWRFEITEDKRINNEKELRVIIQQDQGGH